MPRTMQAMREQSATNPSRRQVTTEGISEEASKPTFIAVR